MLSEVWYDVTLHWKKKKLLVNLLTCLWKYTSYVLELLYRMGDKKRAAIYF